MGQQGVLRAALRVTFPLVLRLYPPYPPASGLYPHWMGTELLFQINGLGSFEHLYPLYPCFPVSCLEHEARTWGGGLKSLGVCDRKPACEARFHGAQFLGRGGLKLHGAEALQKARQWKKGKMRGGACWRHCKRVADSPGALSHLLWLFPLWRRGAASLAPPPDQRSQGSAHKLRVTLRVTHSRKSAEPFIHRGSAATFE